MPSHFFGTRNNSTRFCNFSPAIIMSGLCRPNPLLPNRAIRFLWAEEKAGVTKSLVFTPPDKISCTRILYVCYILIKEREKECSARKKMFKLVLFDRVSMSLC